MSTFNIEASFAYGLTVPGEVQYSSENYRAALTITEEIEAGSEGEARELGIQRVAELATEAKLAVIAQAGLSASTDENGVIRPVLAGEARETVTAAAKAVAKSNLLTEDGALVLGDDAFEAEDGVAEATPMWDGRPIRIFDNRGNKKTERSPDFRIQFLDVDESASDDDKFKPFWLKNKDGSLNKAALKVQSMV